MNSLTTVNIDCMSVKRVSGTFFIVMTCVSRRYYHTLSCFSYKNKFKTTLEGVFMHLKTI